MSRTHLLVVVLVFGLLFGSCLAGSCQLAKDDAKPAVSHSTTEADIVLDQLFQDMDLLYTLNRLDLKPAQVQPLLDLATKVQEDRGKAEPARQTAVMALVPLLREKRALLLQDKEVPEALEKQIQDAQARVDVANETIDQAPAKYVADIKKVLTPAQVAIVTGADEAKAQAEELLEWIRGLSNGDYAEEARSNAEELADPELGLKADAIMKIFDEARKLSTANYAKNKDALVAKLSPLYMPMPEAADDAMIQFFASPRLPVILQERAAK